MGQTDQDAVAAAVAGDEAAFTELVQRHRRELQVHCYRMLGSYDDAEDVVQETFLRAWRRRSTYAGRSTFRAWLYRIATNACARRAGAAARAAPRRPRGAVAAALPRRAAGRDPGPRRGPGRGGRREGDDRARLPRRDPAPPPTARAALILRDVLDWSAKDAAELLDTSVASVNSALQRARAEMRAHLPERRAEWAPGEDPTAAERALVARYIDASERGDMDALAETLKEDLRFSMPPQPGLYTGRERVLGFWISGGFGSAERFGTFRCLVTRANRQPAVANYLRAPGDGLFRAMALDVLRIADGRIAEIVTFDRDAFTRFGLPDAL